ncbi:glucoside xylosyltransferase 2-like [Hyalella azteca]|uniref:Glucoside xylosyltransferase 2-like n=1 Tax=Hyalella azteca TaxID=294128 RepID=A0A979FLN6_HYAAZ|nr:glucoside xylosyltransferase 2-like [Hyalella azteca]
MRHKIVSVIIAATMLVVILRKLANIALRVQGSATDEAWTSNHGHLDARRGPPFVLIICNDGKNDRVGVTSMTKFEAQLRQTKVLIKSALTLSHYPIRFIILGDDDTILPTIEAHVSKWPDRIRDRLTLNYRPVFIPDDWNLVNLYEKCSTARLFLPWALPDLDSIVYIDTDHVFMRPPEHLTQHFENFDDRQVFGMAPSHGYYHSSNVEVIHASQ